MTMSLFIWLRLFAHLLFCSLVAILAWKWRSSVHLVIFSVQKYQKSCSRSCSLVLPSVQKSCSKSCCFGVPMCSPPCKNRAVNRAVLVLRSVQKSCSRSCSLVFSFVQKSCSSLWKLLQTMGQTQYIYIYLFTIIYMYLCTCECFAIIGLHGLACIHSS